MSALSLLVFLYVRRRSYNNKIMKIRTTLGYSIRLRFAWLLTPAHHATTTTISSTKKRRRNPKHWITMIMTIAEIVTLWRDMAQAHAPKNAPFLDRTKHRNNLLSSVNCQRRCQYLFFPISNSTPYKFHNYCLLFFFFGFGIDGVVAGVRYMSQREREREK